MILSDITMINGVNESGQGFVTVTAISEDKQIMVGQLSPDECRVHAMAYLAVAEAAEQDAATLRTVRKLGLDDKLAAFIVNELRESRSE